MITIYKYPLRFALQQEVLIPWGAQILKAGTQKEWVQTLEKEELFLWALVDTDRDSLPYTIMVIGTGDEVPYENWRHIDSVIFADQEVYHVFCRFEPNHLIGPELTNPGKPNEY